MVTDGIAGTKQLFTIVKTREKIHDKKNYHTEGQMYATSQAWMKHS